MGHENIHYRVGTEKDSNQLLDLGIIAYGQYKTVLSPDNWDVFNTNLHNKQRLLDLLSVAQCFVAEDESHIIGMAYIIPSGNPVRFFKPEWSYIRMVAVHPDYEGRGIARALTKMCIHQALQNKEKIIALHTSEFMDAARHIYVQLGFTVLEEIEPLFGKRYWLYTLNLDKKNE